MPYIHSKLPSTASQVIRPTDATGRAQAGVLSAPASPKAAPTPLATDDKAIAPTAPPSAVQLQIKAIITEQAQTLAATNADTSQTLL